MGPHLRAAIAAVASVVAVTAIKSGPATPITTITLVDPARKNRTVTAKLCLPAAAGVDSKLPLYVFGHGFDCAAEDYTYFCEVAATAIVYKLSAVVADLDTANLAKDASFLAAELPRLAREDPSSPLYGKLGGPVVLGGHSMGGGTSILAAASHPKVDGMAVYAPGLYTIPSAKPFLPMVTLPSMIVVGSDDCGANSLPRESQPAYDGLNSTTKVIIVLKGANHCHWAAATEFLGVCKLPECSRIAPESQRALGVRLAQAFFEALRGGAAGWTGFEGQLAEGERNGTWTFVSSRTSAPGKTVHNECPCKASDASVVV